MCDAIAGELLACFRRDDPAANGLLELIRNNGVLGVSFYENVGDRLAKVGLRSRTGLSFEYVRLMVPATQEDFKANILQFLYRGQVQDALHTGRMSYVGHAEILNDPRNTFQVARNSILSAAAKTHRPPTTGAFTTGFKFDAMHQTYLKLLGVAGGATGKGRCVAILDSGLDPNLSLPVSSGCNFIDPNQPKNTADDHGHGTAVASIIHAISPSAGLVVYKVMDARGEASEWDTLAALAAAPPSGCRIDLFNMSLDFGLADLTCAYCGRESMSSRSAVFESMLDQLGTASDCLVVGAAGNFGKHELAFPARFGTTLAVVACDSNKKVAGFSNSGAADEDGKPHANVFVLPGGQKTNVAGSSPTEFVGTSTNGSQYWGTSFAAAYASGLVASIWSKPAHAGKDAAQLLSKLRAKALPIGNNPNHGNGLMQDC